MGNTGNTWITRAETRADIPVIREITLAAFGREHEADIVDKLRADESAWIEGLSLVVTDPEAASGTMRRRGPRAHPAYPRPHRRHPRALPRARLRAARAAA